MVPACLPSDVRRWIDRLSALLDARLSWRLLPLLTGLLFATGAASIFGDLTNNSYVNLLDGVSTLTVTGDYTQGGTLTVAELTNANSCNQLIVQGTANLGGTLTVNELGNPPQQHETLTIMTYGNVNGNFGTISTRWTGIKGGTTYQVEFTG